MRHASRVLDLIEDLRAKERDFCVATVVRTANLTSAKAGAKAVVTPDGEMSGFIGGACVSGAARSAALRAMRSGKPEMIRVRPRDEVDGAVDSDGAPLFKSSCPSGGTVEIFVEPMAAARRVVVMGDSPVAHSIVLVARDTGFRVVHAVPEGGERARGADSRIEGFDLGKTPLRAGDCVVVATQGRGDRKAMTAALLSEAGHVSMVGSHRKIAALKEALAAEGAVPQARIAALKGPAGLDIGAVGPEEIALSVIAEAVSVRRRGNAAGAGESADS